MNDFGRWVNDLAKEMQEKYKQEEQEEYDRADLELMGQYDDDEEEDEVLDIGIYPNLVARRSRWERFMTRNKSGDQVYDPLAQQDDDCDTSKMNLDNAE